MASRVAALEEENAKLVAEMASMKKKIMVHLKRQQAELQAKVQAAESRAAAAEAALASSQLGNNKNLVATEARDEDEGNTSQSSQAGGSCGGDLADGKAEGASEEIENLKAELEEERERHRKFEEAAAAEKHRLEAQIEEFKRILEEESSKRDETRKELERELKNSQENSKKHIEELTKVNEKLEVQLLAAAAQVSEAFARISSTHDDMERISKEGYESKQAHATLMKENERISNELEKTRAALTQAEKDIEGKTKDIEEIAAVRKAAQEGQNAAMDQLMKRLCELEAAAVAEKNEVETGRLEVIIEENAKLSEQLQERSATVRKWQECSAELQRRLIDFNQGFNQFTEQQREIVDALDGTSAHDGDLLIRVINQLKFQNESLKSLLDFWVQTTESGSLEGYTKQSKEMGPVIFPDDLNHLHQQILDLNKQLDESRSSYATAEDHLKQFQLACSESEQRVQELSATLAEVHEKMNSEIKERDEKYMELDAKFGRLQKRAKQRIQELQKEKEDVEAQLSIEREKSTQAIGQQSVAQQELERTRLQASEALRSLDGEKQQLRSATNRQKQKEIVDELRRTLEAKEHTIEELQQSCSEKDQMLQDMQASLRVMEEKHQASLSELGAKHQKLVEGFESQLADAMSERSKAAEAISTLQLQLADKESRLAELDAASTGEAVRLGAALEAAKGEVVRLKQEHQKEKQSCEAALQAVKAKLEESERFCLQYEINSAKTRSQLEAESALLQQALNVAQADLVAAREEISHLENDFASYKVRAHALLQKKDAELSAVKDAELIAAQEAALKEAQREAALALAERDRAMKALQDSVRNHETELAARAVALIDAEQRIRDMATKLESTRAQLQSEQEAWQSSLQNVEETWRLKCEALEAQVNKTAKTGLDEDLKSLKISYEKMKEEHDSFREMANNMIEAKDKEITRLLDDNNNLQRSLHAKPQVENDHVSNPASIKPDSSVSLVAAAEQQILLLARQQAQREEELAQCQRHIQALQEEIDELERENRLHSQQESMLKNELRNMERVQKRDSVDMTYLKNVILKLLETGEVGALLPVIGTLLQFSPEEIRKCQETYNAVPDVPLSSATAIVDAAPSTSRSLLSRLTFSNGI